MRDLERDVYTKSLRYLKKFCNPADAEDALQEAAIEYVRLPETPSNPAGWLISRARCRALDALRRRECRARRHAEAQRKMPPVEQWSPEDRLWSMEVLARLSPVSLRVLMAEVRRARTASSTDRARTLRARQELASLCTTT